METQNEPVKRPYHAPSLKVYGDIRAVTMAVATIQPTTDGGTGKTNKTA